MPFAASSRHRWPLAVLALALALPAAHAAPTDAAWGPSADAIGVTVTVPEGYRWLKDPPKKPASTVIYLQAEGGMQHPATILVNHVLATAGSNEESIFAAYREYAERAEDAQVVELPSGRFMRVDFTVTVGPRSIRQRCYATLRDKHQYSFFLANLDAPAFAQAAPAFDAMVAGARFGPVAVERPPVAAKPPAPSAPEPAPGPAPQEPRPLTPVRPQPEPKPAQPEPKPPQPDTPQPPRPAQPEPPTPKPAQPQPEPAQPQPPKPAQPDTPRPVQPGTPRPAQPDTPAPEAPRARITAPQELLRAATLVRFDSEYDATLWAAAHLIDGRADRGWCSSVRARAPHRFVFGLEHPTRLARLVFDNACPEEQGFEGVSTAGFAVEVSTEGADGPYQQVLEGTLARGKNDQAFDLPTVAEARWLRLTIRNNHGHPTLTELMDVRAYAEGGLPVAAAVGEFHLDRVRASRARNGEALPDGQAFRPGERVWVNLKPRGLVVGAEHKTWLEIDLVLEDPQGRELLRRDRVVDQVAAPPTPPLSTFVALHLDLPPDFPAGSYAVRLVARDRIAQTSAAAVCPFVVAR